MLHSRSPAIHLAAAVAAGVEMEYRAIPVRPDQLSDMIIEVRRTGMRGLSVTMPHKAAVIPELDELTESAQLLGAVNHITNTDGHLVGNNTDGGGFLFGLEHRLGVSVSGLGVVVIGAGGAARAIVHACADAGASSVSVIARRPEAARSAADLAGSAGSVGEPEVIEDADVVINATPVGMSGTPDAMRTPFDVARLQHEAIVSDIVYNPLDTPLLLAARRRGLRTVDGLAMLAGQAAAQFTTWTGLPAPLDVMIAAASPDDG